MSDKPAELPQKNINDTCLPLSAELSSQLTTLCEKPSQAHLSSTAKNMLAGFGISETAQEKATEAALFAGTGAITSGLGAASLKGAEIGVGKLGAAAFDPALRLVGGAMRFEALANGSVVREIIAAPFAPRMAQVGARYGVYGAAAGLALYGAYEGYKYLTSDKQK